MGCNFPNANCFWWRVVVGGGGNLVNIFDWESQ